jgi:hypothetical protein
VAQAVGKGVWGGYSGLGEGTDFVGAAVACWLIVVMGWETVGFLLPLALEAKVVNTLPRLTNRFLRRP